MRRAFPNRTAPADRSARSHPGQIGYPFHAIHGAPPVGALRRAKTQSGQPQLPVRNLSRCDEQGQATDHQEVSTRLLYRRPKAVEPRVPRARTRRPIFLRYGRGADARRAILQRASAFSGRPTDRRQCLRSGSKGIAPSDLAALGELRDEVARAERKRLDRLGRLAAARCDHARPVAQEQVLHIMGPVIFVDH